MLCSEVSFTHYQLLCSFLESSMFSPASDKPSMFLMKQRGTSSPISLFVASCVMFLWRPVMEELASALPISGAPYTYLSASQFSSSFITIVTLTVRQIERFIQEASADWCFVIAARFLSDICCISRNSGVLLGRRSGTTISSGGRFSRSSPDIHPCQSQRDA